MPDIMKTGGRLVRRAAFGLVATLLMGVAGCAAPVAPDTPAPDTLDDTFTIRSTAYHDDAYGFTLTLPERFVGRGYVVKDGQAVRFGLKDAMPHDTDDPTEAGAVMWLGVQATATLQDQFGEDWALDFPVGCRALAERDGLTYYLWFASDIQFDPTEEAIVAAYRAMEESAGALDGSALSFEGQTAAQRAHEREAVLRDLAEQYAYTRMQPVDGAYIEQLAIEPDTATGSCVLTLRYRDDAGGVRTTTERLWYDGVDSVIPATREALS
ncbi:MAG: hypothetical protein Q4D31_06085 [Eubacteriales bacterium]|nr:hypothetical protein [Eubacteriales bacterium]